MTTATHKPRTKKATPLSTHSLAAFLTWRQFDLLLLLETEGEATTQMLSDWIIEIHKYDMRHGGAFYGGVDYGAVYSGLRTMEGRQLVSRFVAHRGFVTWTITDRGVQALNSLKQ